jgi:hypothetical protein
MPLEYTLRRFDDGAIPVYLVVDARDGRPITDSNARPYQSISPALLRLWFESNNAPGWFVYVETPEASALAPPR